jgi:hypothetical protein
MVLGGSDFREIVKVDVAVDKIAGLKNAHEPEEGFKTPVASVFFVVNAQGRGMGEKYIDKTPPEDPVKDEPRQYL